MVTANIAGLGMKVTREKAAENRQALVDAASRLFRAKGIDGVGVAEISKAAGLTHGALYAQFASKDALAAAAMSAGLERSLKALTSSAAERPSALGAYLDFLISPRQRDNLSTGCPMTASASEVSRQDESVCASFVSGFEAMVREIEAVLGPSRLEATARQRALLIMAAHIGTVAVARAAFKSQPALSDELIETARQLLGQIGGEG